MWEPLQPHSVLKRITTRPEDPRGLSHVLCSVPRRRRLYVATCWAVLVFAGQRGRKPLVTAAGSRQARDCRADCRAALKTMRALASGGHERPTSLPVSSCFPGNSQDPDEPVLEFSVGESETRCRCGRQRSAGQLTSCGVCLSSLHRPADSCFGPETQRLRGGELHDAAAGLLDQTRPD